MPLVSKKIIYLTLLISYCMSVHAQRVIISYKESFDDFPNPERGFYIPYNVHVSKFAALNAEKIKNDRANSQKHGSATYPIYSTLVYREYVLDSFTGKPLSSFFLDEFDNDCNIVRNAGSKMILRFAYTDKTHDGNCPDKEKICPPYGDAPKAIMLHHIAQLKPLLQKNADIIAVLQEGFIGIWGENFYTDYFGDPSDNGAGKITDQNWIDRNELLKALLDALPKNRMVQVRTPQIKQKFVFGPRAPIYSSPLSDTAAYHFEDKARIGFHNDCFLASKDDYGTFFDYGSSVENKKPANETMRKYFKTESRFGPVGGETCDDAFSPENDCAPAGQAEQEMSAMHYSFLNTAYNNTVNNDWDSAGCMNAIKRKLGYRFVLLKGSFPSHSKAGIAFNFTIDLKNIGYASPFNLRYIFMVLRNIQTKSTYCIRCKADMRRWYTGNIRWNESVKIPGDIPAGKYELLLYLPDEYASLAGRSEYSIRFANENVWEQNTGYNRLNQIITVGQ
jgi:hypothetical protein